MRRGDEQPCTLRRFARHSNVAGRWPIIRVARQIGLGPKPDVSPACITWQPVAFSASATACDSTPSATICTKAPGLRSLPPYKAARPCNASPLGRRPHRCGRNCTNLTDGPGRRSERRPAPPAWAGRSARWQWERRAARASCETSFRWFLSLLVRHQHACMRAKGTATSRSHVQQRPGHRPGGGASGPAVGKSWRRVPEPPTQDVVWIPTRGATTAISRESPTSRRYCQSHDPHSGTHRATGAEARQSTRKVLLPEFASIAVSRNLCRPT